ncbi:hypothetical protein SFRURICE_009926 [Spodoptera frugiperda]|nr:hypothetical protein SFRURICE_009926 [Spodoptera frugiperda]
MWVHIVQRLAVMCTSAYPLGDKRRDVECKSCSFVKWSRGLGFISRAGQSITELFRFFKNISVVAWSVEVCPYTAIGSPPQMVYIVQWRYVP